MDGFHKRQKNKQFCLSGLLPAAFWTDCTKGKSSVQPQQLISLGIRFRGDAGGVGMIPKGFSNPVIPWIPDSLSSVFMSPYKVQQTKSSCNLKAKLSPKIKFRRKVLNSQAPDQPREIPTSFTAQTLQENTSSRKQELSTAKIWLF